MLLFSKKAYILKCKLYWNFKKFMPPQQQQQSSGGDTSFAPLWISVSLVLLAYITWLYAHKYIIAFFFQLNIWQTKLILLLFSDSVLQIDLLFMQTVNPESVTWYQLVNVTEHIGNYMRYPVTLILLSLSLVVYISNIKLKFRRVHDMRTLRKQEQENWTAIMPIVKKDLANEDIAKGPWAMALTPLEFARKYNLLKKEDLMTEPYIAGMECTAGIKSGEAKRVFTLQLGPYFDGFHHCTPAVTAVAAVFMARINRDRDAATLILNTINRTWVAGTANYAIAKPILNKYIHTELVKEVMAKHAYLLTVMASLIAAAREDGVVPSAEFLWLKPTDRRLWYMLNCIGRQTPFAEVAGPFAHWQAEKRMLRRSLVPMIDEATVALNVAIKDIKLSVKEVGSLES